MALMCELFSSFSLAILPFNKLDHQAAPSVLIVVIGQIGHLSQMFKLVVGLNKIHLIDRWEILEICAEFLSNDPVPLMDVPVKTYIKIFAAQSLLHDILFFFVLEKGIRNGFHSHEHHTFKPNRGH
jgi:hypothetical protein